MKKISNKQTLGPIYIKKSFVQSINMINPRQNEIKQFNKDINLLQYKLKKLNDAGKQATKTKKQAKANHGNE